MSKVSAAAWPTPGYYILNYSVLVVRADVHKKGNIYYLEGGKKLKSKQKYHIRIIQTLNRQLLSAVVLQKILESFRANGSF